MLNDRQPMVAAKNLAGQKFHSGRSLAQRFKFFDFVLQPPDFGFLHFHRAKFNALIDGNPANMVDNSFASFQPMLAELVERGIGGGNGVVYAIKHAVSAREAAAAGSRDGSFNFSKHLLDNRANKFFSSLHCFTANR
jgi:hypothetical protein